jgi:hypothetical protein
MAQILGGREYMESLARADAAKHSGASERGGTMSEELEEVRLQLEQQQGEIHRLANSRLAVCNERDAARSQVACLREALESVLSEFPDAKIIEDLEPLNPPKDWPGRGYPTNAIKSKLIAGWRAGLASTAEAAAARDAEVEARGALRAVEHIESKLRDASWWMWICEEAGAEPDEDLRAELLTWLDDLDVAVVAQEKGATP